MTNYKGWIPTVGGRLSFSIIGASNSPTKASFENLPCGEQRYIICHQKRRLNDSAAPFKNITSKLFYKYETLHWGLCLASGNDSSTEANGKLTGKLFFFSGKKMWMPRPKWVCSTLMNDLKKSSGQIDPTTDFKSEFEKASEELTAECSYFVNFILERNGVISISPPSDNELNNLSHAPKFPQGNAKKKLENDLCSQLFFFFKDIAHRHQHHDESTDTMIDLHPADKNDLEWRCKTLRSIYQAVLRFKRIKKENVHESALGILAYIKSFKNICKKDLKEDCEKLNPTLDDNLLEQSIKASQDTIKREAQENIKNSERIRNIMFGFLGVFFSLISVLNLVREKLTPTLPEPHPILKSIAFSFLEKPIITFAIVIVVYIAMLMHMKVIPYEKWTYLRDLTRLTNSFNIYFVSLLMILFGFLVFALSYYLVIYIL